MIPMTAPFSLSRFDVPQAFATSVLRPIATGAGGVVFSTLLSLIGAKLSPFSVTMFAGRHQSGVGISDNHSDQLVSFEQSDAFDATGVSTHRPGIGFFETNGHAGFGRQHHLVTFLGHNHIDQFIILAKLDGNDSTSTGPAVILKWRFFDEPIFGGHHQVVIFCREITNGATIGDFFAVFELDQIDNGATATLSTQLGQFIYFAPQHTSFGGKEQKIVMRRRGKDVFDRIFVFAFGALDSRTAATLFTISADRRPFDVTTMANRNDHVFFFD